MNMNNKLLLGALVTASLGLVGQTPGAPALEGLDPVALVQGKEAPGKNSISVEKGGFLYVFDSEENKKRFLADPDRYGIQNDGICQRMGAPVNGNPDLWTVHQGKIYIFGSPGCHKAFAEAPEKYLDPPAATGLPASVQENGRTNARALLEKAVQAMGSATAVDAVSAYVMQSSRTRRNTQGEEVVNVRRMITAFPARFRIEQVANGRLMFAQVVSPESSFTAFGGGTQELNGSRAKAARSQVERYPLAILRARKQKDFDAAWIGTSTNPEAERVAIFYAGELIELGIDAKSGRVLSLSYAGRSSQGFTGTVTLLYSDFRKTGALELPYKIAGMHNGQPDAGFDVLFDSISIDPALSAEAFQKPARSAR